MDVEFGVRKMDGDDLVVFDAARDFALVEIFEVFFSETMIEVKNMEVTVGGFTLIETGFFDEEFEPFVTVHADETGGVVFVVAVGVVDKVGFFVEGLADFVIINES